MLSPVTPSIFGAPSFGIYIKTKKTSYGQCTIGKYKGNNIEVYDDRVDKAKLYYVSDSLRRWIKSKLVYFDKGIKKVIRSSATNKNGTG